MRGLQTPGNPGPVAHRVGDTVLWASADGRPLGVTASVPEGDTAPWAAVASVHGTSAEASRRARAFVAALTPSPAEMRAIVAEATEVIDLTVERELATVDYLARLSG